jgi:DNA invertase Pin-like site-specific DNA recombinase
MVLAYSYVRMSSGPQLKGDSLRRQVERSEKFAADHGLTLDREFRLTDLGLSAFTGAHLKTGALGRFLEAVRAGKIERGSFLIVESLDRLSRQKVIAALSMFLELLVAGIKVVTLIDEQVYDTEVNANELMNSLGQLARAHDESVHKSDRGAKAWEAKRRSAGTKNLTSTCRTWLKPRTDKKGFDVIEGHAKIIRRIFSDCADHGMGVKAIAIRLNSEGVKPFGPRGRAWTKTFVLRLLRSRTVLGEFQPCTRVGGKSQPTGDTINGYYPAIVTDDLYFRAQNALNKRRGGGGRKGSKFTNLFGKIAACARCGARLHIVHKGTKGGRSLACSNAREGSSDCRPVSWKLTDFERSFLTFCREIDLSALSTSVIDQHERQAVDAEIQAIEGRLEDAKVHRDRAFQLVVEAGSDYVRAKLRELDELVVEMEAKLKALTEKQRQLSRESEAFAKSRVEIASLIEQIQTHTGDQAYVLRSTLASRLRDIVEAVRVFPGHPSTDSERRSSAASHVGRYFRVEFKDGTARTVFPSPKDPARFEWFAASHEGTVTDHQVRGLLSRYGIAEPTPEQYGQMVEDLVAAGRSHFLGSGLEMRELMKLEVKWRQDLSDAERAQLHEALKEPIPR